MNGYMKSILLGALICLTACVSAAKHTRAQTALVLDEETQQPIEGAIVVARWIGTISQLVDSQTTCYHVESATTDVQGQYSIPAWTKLPGKVHHNEIAITVYRSGYIEDFKDVKYKAGTFYERVNADVLYMKRDNRSVKERLEYLISSTVSCSATEDTKLSNLYQRMYSEAENIVSTKEDKLQALILLIEVEKQKVGSTEAWRRFEERKLELR